MLIFAFCLQRGEGTRPGLPGKQFRRESRPRPRRRPHTAAPTWIVIPKTCVYQRARKSGPTEAGEIAGRPEKGGGRGALRKTAPGISLRNRPCQRACAGTVSLLTSWAASRTRWGIRPGTHLRPKPETAGGQADWPEESERCSRYIATSAGLRWRRREGEGRRDRSVPGARDGLRPCEARFRPVRCGLDGRASRGVRLGTD